MTTDNLETLRLAADTRVIRVRLRTEDVARLRQMAYAERRPPQDQAAYLLEQALRAYGQMDKSQIDKSAEGEGA